MFISKYKSLELKKRVRIETAVLTMFFISTLFMPFCDIFSLIENEQGEWIGEKVETALLFESQLVFIYSFCFLLLALSFLSFNRYVVSLINPSVILITLLVSFYLMMMLHWSGKHRQPELRYGYWINLSLIIISIIKGYMWRKDFYATEKGKRNFIIMSIILTCAFAIGIYWLFRNG